MAALSTPRSSGHARGYWQAACAQAADDCPPIAGGEGSVVTAGFVTREVHVVASRSETIPWNMTIMAS